MSFHANARRRLVGNVFANYAAVAWLAVLSLLTAPWYFGRMGAEGWGVVVICMSVQALMAVLDAGLSQFMPRDVARTAHADGDMRHLVNVFRSAYAVMALTGFVVGQAMVPLIARHWLSLSPERLPAVQLALHVVIVQFACQLANNASLGYWNGTQRQVRASLSQCGFTTAKHAAAVLLVLCWQATPLAWLIPFALISAAEWAFNDWRVRRELAGQPTRPVTWGDLRRLWREAALLVAGVLLGMFLSQLDRLALSAHVTIADFGRYGLVASLSLAFLQLQQPVVRAWQPMLAVLAGSPASRIATWRMALSLMAACALPCALAAWQAPAILQAWVGDGQTTALGSMPMRLLLAAVALNAVYQVLYQTMLLANRAHHILKINIAIVAVMTPLSFLLAQRFGIVGGGLVWLGISLLQVALGGFAVARR